VKTVVRRSNVNVARDFAVHTCRLGRVLVLSPEH
jgi:hypothetical protein